METMTVECKEFANLNDMLTAVQRGAAVDICGNKVTGRYLLITRGVLTQWIVGSFDSYKDADRYLSMHMDMDNGEGKTIIDSRI